MLNRNTLAVTVVVALGSLGLASSASASDATVKAAGEAHDAQFASLAAKQREATVKWLKAGHSRRTAKPLLRVLEAADRLDKKVTQEVKAQAPSTQAGAQAKIYVLQSNANYSRYLTTLERGIRLATRGKTAAANRKLQISEGYAELADRESRAADALLKQVG